MKTLGKLLFGLFIGLFLSSIPLQAMEESPNQLSLRGGGAFPTSANDFNESARAGFMGGVQYLRHLSPRFSLGGQVDYLSFPGKSRSITLPAGQLNATSDSSVTLAQVVARYSLRPDKKLSPYLLGGVGIADFEQTTTGSPAGVTSWADTGTREERTVADDSSTGISALIGFGVEMPLSSRIMAALEVDWHVFGVDNSKFGTDFINVPAVLLQVGYRF